MPRTLGVCSWSLQPSSPSRLAASVAASGYRAVQLHLDPLRANWDERATVEALNLAGITILSGMMTMEGEDYSTLESIRATGGIRPDATWAHNLDAAHANALLAQRLAISLVSFHAGWIPHEPGNAERATMVGRLRRLADVFAYHGVKIALETGQETPATLVDVLDELPDIGVNFDPANMILYAMGDPHEALEQLGARVAQIHIKDALPTRTPGTWGEEVAVGTGGVDWVRLLHIAHKVCPQAHLVVEREAGDQRLEDVRTARRLVEPILGALA